MTAAVAFPDSSIHFYNLETQKWTSNVLQNIQMIGIQSSDSQYTKRSAS